MPDAGRGGLAARLVRCRASSDAGVTAGVRGDTVLRRVGMLLSRASSCNPPLACREDTTKPQSVALGCGMCVLLGKRALPRVGHLPPTGGVLLSTPWHCRCFVCDSCRCHMSPTGTRGAAGDCWSSVTPGPATSPWLTSFPWRAQQVPAVPANRTGQREWWWDTTWPSTGHSSRSSTLSR